MVKENRQAAILAKRFKGNATSAPDSQEESTWLVSIQLPARHAIGSTEKILRDQIGLIAEL